jgi:hypothetical protein
MPDDANIFGFFAGCRAAAEMLRLCLARSGFFLSGGGLTRPSPFFSGLLVDWSRVLN